jgi:hypothetical protein
MNPDLDSEQTTRAAAAAAAAADIQGYRRLLSES